MWLHVIQKVIHKCYNSHKIKVISENNEKKKKKKKINTTERLIIQI